jgi:hypothetical protein
VGHCPSSRPWQPAHDPAIIPYGLAAKLFGCSRRRVTVECIDQRVAMVTMLVSIDTSSAHVETSDAIGLKGPLISGCIIRPLPRNASDDTSLREHVAYLLRPPRAAIHPVDDIVARDKTRRRPGDDRPRPCRHIRRAASETGRG